jgi:4a-hydroxytetrahydrobiopterin dehydratase
MTLQKLQPADVQLAMNSLSGWTLDTKIDMPCLLKSWKLPSFDAAVVRFNQIAQLAQAQNHHPEVLSSYTQLQVRLWTHDVGGLTDKDFKLAHSIDDITSSQPTPL